MELCKKIYIKLKICFYKLLSEQWPKGKFWVHSPCLFAGNGQILLGKSCALGFFPSAGFYSGYAHIEARGKGAIVEIGEGTCISNHATIVAVRKIHIGRNCRIGGEFVCFDSDFHGLRSSQRDEVSCAANGEVYIGDDVFIGQGVMVLKGVSLGRGCVVGAGAVVTHSFEPDSIIAGNRAKLIGTVCQQGVIK